MFKIERNEGTLDRVVRLVIALNFFGWAYFGFTGVWAIVLYILGIAALVTSLIGYCGLYSILKINTIKK